MLDKSTTVTAPPATVTRATSAVPRALKRYLALDDFEATARRRIPKFLYGYISGGAESDAAVRDNRKAFDEYGFVPRVLNDVSGRDQTTTLFGKTYASPFGIPPMGSSALCAYRGDIVLTRAAAAANVPMILSASSLITLEDVRRENQAAWYQAYLAGLPARIEPLVDRVAAAGYDTFVVTADVPVPPNRENNIRNGFQVPLAITPQVAWDTVDASALAVRHLATHREEPRHAAFREHGCAARPAGAGQEPDAQHRRPRPARLEACRTDPQALEGQARRQGTGLACRRPHRARERRRRRDALQPWRPPARLHDVGPAHAAGDRGGSQRHDDHGRRRHPPRHRRDQGAGARRRISSGSAGRSSMRRSPAARPAWRARSACCMPRSTAIWRCSAFAASARSRRIWCGSSRPPARSRIARRAHAQRRYREQHGRDALGHRDARARPSLVGRSATQASDRAATDGALHAGRDQCGECAHRQIFSAVPNAPA